VSESTPMVMGELLTQEPGVEAVAEGVAEEVKGEDAEHDGDSGEERHVGGVEEVGACVVEHGSPTGGGGRDAEAEEAEGGFCEDGAGHADGGLNDDGLQDVGEDVADEDAEGAGSECAGGLDVLAVSGAHDLGADKAGVADPTADGEGEDEVAETGAEEGDEGDGEEDSGEGEEGVHEVGGEEGVHEATAVSGDGADHQADGEGDGDDADGDEQGDTRAEEDAGEDVAAKFICTKEMRVGGGEQACGQVEGGGVCRGEMGGKDGDKGEGSEEGEPHYRRQGGAGSEWFRLEWG